MRACVLRRVAGWIGWVAGWVAGGCWDDDITSDEMMTFPKIPCVLYAAVSQSSQELRVTV